MDNVETFVHSLNDILATKSKRHIIGGILMSISLLFGGLAVTTITLKHGGNR